MNTKMQNVLKEARQLSPSEQLELIRALSEWLQEQYREADGQSNQDAIPDSVRRTKPATNLKDYVADFWPEDESVDELNEFIRQQRGVERLSDQ